MMNKLSPIDILSDARKRGEDWMDIAQAFDALQIEASSVPAGTTPARWAEKLSGYSVNHLHRMSAGRQFYLELTAVDPVLAASLDVRRFSHFEVLAKIWRLDRDQVLQLLERQPKLSYAGLSQIFEATQRQLPMSKAAGKRVQTQFRNACIEAIVKQPDPLLCMGPGAYTLMSPRVHSVPYCKPDLLIKRVAVSGETAWAGIDFLVVDNPRDDTLQRRLVALATESTFLAAHWLCLPDNDKLVEHIRDATGQLELANLGIATLAGDALVAMQMPSGPPGHDRRGIWQPPRLWRDIMEIRTDDET